jgi:hypothetical protein
MTNAIKATRSDTSRPRDLMARDGFRASDAWNELRVMSPNLSAGGAQTAER